MKVACIQPKINKDRAECYNEIDEILKDLSKKVQDCEIVCLPERWVPFHQNFKKNIQAERGSDYTAIQNFALKYKIKIISGAIWEQRDKLEKPVITCYYFNEKGEEIGRQDKIHLYTYEKEQFERGKELKLFKFNSFSYFSILICFDMAFIETPRLAIESGADILFSPTQISEDGMYNWNIYLQARALENRVPIVACNTFGNYLKRKFLGYSKIISFYEGKISPSKLKIVEGPMNENGFISDNINLKFPRKLREIRLKEKIDKNKIKVKKIMNF
ncbi:hypothetical protein LCGC14_2551070 [marine sediment metagenome]|uniref:CN hydrolase domain-containing protein n=1 Tax=marine sediment metagenome TaxID=412755 RepID=A0A0F9AMT0_9ZZZZ